MRPILRNSDVRRPIRSLKKCRAANAFLPPLFRSHRREMVAFYLRPRRTAPCVRPVGVRPVNSPYDANCAILLYGASIHALGSDGAKYVIRESA